MSLRELELAVESLNSSDYERFCTWLEDREAERKLAWLRAAVAEAAEQSERGERMEGRPVMMEMIERLNRRIEEADAR